MMQGNSDRHRRAEAANLSAAYEETQLRFAAIVESEIPIFISCSATLSGFSPADSRVGYFGNQNPACLSSELDFVSQLRFLAGCGKTRFE